MELFWHYYCEVIKILDPAPLRVTFRTVGLQTPCLTPHGVMVINISFPDEKHYINGLFQIRQISKKTLFLSVPDYNNLLVFILGQHIPVCTSATLLNNATCLEQQCHLDFAELADRLIKQNQNFFKRSLS